SRRRRLRQRRAATATAAWATWTSKKAGRGGFWAAPVSCLRLPGRPHGRPFSFLLRTTSLDALLSSRLHARLKNVTVQRRQSGGDSQAGGDQNLALWRLISAIRSWSRTVAAA